MTKQSTEISMFINTSDQLIIEGMKKNSEIEYINLNHDPGMYVIRFSDGTAGFLNVAGGRDRQWHLDLVNHGPRFRSLGLNTKGQFYLYMKSCVIFELYELKQYLKNDNPRMEA